MLVDLFNHMEWADALMWDAAFNTPGARSDETLRWLMLHLHGVQKAFLDAWTNQPFSFRGDYSDTTLEHELAAVRAYYPRCRSFLESLDSARLSEPLIVPWAKWAEQLLGRPPGPTTLGETILQTVAHSTHHRAQASVRLRALGAQPPMVDYIAWLWLERPDPCWPARS